MEDGTISNEELVDHELLSSDPSDSESGEDDDEPESTDELELEAETECPLLKANYAFEARYVLVKFV